MSVRLSVCLSVCLSRIPRSVDQMCCTAPHWRHASGPSRQAGRQAALDPRFLGLVVIASPAGSC